MPITKKQIRELFQVGTRWNCVNSLHPLLCGERKLLKVEKDEMCWELEDGRQPWMKIPTPDEIHEIREGYLKCALGKIGGHTLEFTLIPEIQPEPEQSEYEFTVFAPVKARLRMHLKATSQEEACRKLLEEIEKPTGGIYLHGIFDKKSPNCPESEWVELDEGSDLGVLVDRVGDENFGESRWYGFHGDNPVLLSPEIPMFGLTEFMKAQERIKELETALDQLSQAAEGMRYASQNDGVQASNTIAVDYAVSTAKALLAK